MEFNKASAECFLEEVPNYLDDAEEDLAGRVEINLVRCSEPRSVDQFPTLDGPGDERVRLIYILEASSIRCLAAELEKTQVTTVVSYDLTEVCGDG